MTLKKIGTALLCLLTVTLNAQHDNIWYFGDHGGLDFSSGNPEPLNGSAMYTYEGSAVIADTDGNLMFYTNGETVWNKEHEVMSNGGGLHGNTSATQSCIAVPAPGQPDFYYLFTVDDIGGPAGLKYSIVDMNGDGGSGQVTDKNIGLTPSVCEKITATYHANGHDIWILAHDMDSDAFLAYLLTESGVAFIPVTSNAGFTIESSDTYGYALGYMVLSPDASRLAMASSYVGVQLFNFDNATGEVSNAITLHDSGDHNYGLEFSPSGKRLYAAIDQQLHQYQIDAGDIPTSGQVIFSFNTTLGALKIGPDSKIYLVSGMGQSSVSVINNPDIAGEGCGFELNSINIANDTQWGLPVFFTSPFYVLDILADNTCVGSGVAFTGLFTEVPDSVHWDFGDGTFSGELTPHHQYGSPGTYTIKIRAIMGDFARYFTKEIVVSEGTLAYTPADMQIISQNNCYGDFDLESQNPVVLGEQDAGGYEVSYHTTEQDAENGTNPLAGPGPYTNVQNPQTIYARVTSKTSGCFAVASFIIEVLCPDVETFWGIPRGISPDNDGNNDSLDLSGLNITKIQIFNRHGLRVYVEENYTDQWHGQSVSGQELPSGTYFYVVSMPDGSSKSGWVYINR
jgi:gliding motility-associated-like protein